MTAISFSASRPDPASPQARLRPARHARTATSTRRRSSWSGTQAAVKSLQPHEVAALGAQAVLCNTYHLYLRPGADLVAELGGLHQFMGWHGPMFTDSGGYQVFSLGFGLRARRSARSSGCSPTRTHATPPPARQPTQARLSRVDEDGVTFTLAHRRLDAPTDARIVDRDPGEARRRRHPGVRRADLAAPRRGVHGAGDGADPPLGRALAGGARRARPGALRDRAGRRLPAAARRRARRSSAGCRSTASRSAARWASRSATWSGCWTGRCRRCPTTGRATCSASASPRTCFACVERGIDTFDCVAPTRHARRGVLLTADGPLTITQARYREDDGPIDPDCACPTCTTFSRAYLRHLFVAEELLAYTLATTHNLAFILGLMARIRDAHRGRWHAGRAQGRHAGPLRPGAAPADLLAGLAVGHLAHEIGVADVAGRLLDHVDQDPAQRVGPFGMLRDGVDRGGLGDDAPSTRRPRLR